MSRRTRLHCKHTFLDGKCSKCGHNQVKIVSVQITPAIFAVDKSSTHSVLVTPEKHGPQGYITMQCHMGNGHHTCNGQAWSENPCLCTCHKAVKHETAA